MPVTNPKLAKRYYQALLARDAGFLGAFFVGVHTTSVFCLPTCRARKPLEKNTTFYTNIPEVIDAGYRPCKVCKPTENPHALPNQIVQAMELAEEDNTGRITDAKLEEQGLNPIFIRRWFRKRHGMTFHQFRRSLLIRKAKVDIQEGKRVTDTAFESGYESLSGFGYAFRKVTGHAPKDGKEDT